MKMYVLLGKVRLVIFTKFVNSLVHSLVCTGSKYEDLSTADQQN
jgi:hypothetical protein